MSISASSTSSLLGEAKAPSLHRKWILKRRPKGIFDPNLDTELTTDTSTSNTILNGDNTKTTTEAPLGDHQVVVAPELLSVDAFIRTMLDEKAYHGSVPLGATIPAVGYGTVVWAGPKSGHSVGATVAGMLSASDRVVVEGKALFPCFKFPFLSQSASLGLMGLTTGLTAYAGVFYAPSRPPRKGETVVVTGAAGAVGSIAVQLCKSTGARVVGIAGGKPKNDYLTNQLHCDAVVDYKDTTTTLDQKLAAACPDGIDFVYDNVGGETLDALLLNINSGARIVICGAISQYSGNLNSDTNAVRGPSNYLKLAEKGAEMRGFNVMQYFKSMPFMLGGMFYLWARGKVAMTEHYEEGLERFPHALQKLFTGETIGKTLVRLKKE